MSRIITILLIITITSACSLLNKPKVTKIEKISDNTIVYQGKINEENVAKFEQILINSSTPINQLVIKSGGGSMSEGNKFGQLVRDHQLNVVVKKHCFSSCANYIIPAAKQVTIEPKSFIGWHGGAFAHIFVPMKLSFIDWLALKLIPQEKLENKLNQKIQDSQIMEEEFFTSVNANLGVTILGMLPELIEQIDQDETPFYSYDETTLKKLGLNIHFEDKQIEYNKKGKKLVHIFTLSDNEYNKHIAELNKRIKEERNLKATRNTVIGL